MRLQAPEGVLFCDGEARIPSRFFLARDEAYSCKPCIHGTLFKMNKRSPRKFGGSWQELKALPCAYIPWLQICKLPARQIA